MASPQNVVSVSRRPPDVEDYIDMLRRYRSWIIAPMFAGLVIAVVVAFLSPDTYMSQAVLRITPQQVPEKFVPSAVSSQVAERLAQMQTEILSRNGLADIIQKPALDLFKKERNRLPMEDIVTEMRSRISIKPVGSGSGSANSGGRLAAAFTITFSYTDRYKAQQVVRELVTRFTDQNSDVAKKQALLTTNFLSEELKEKKEKMDAAGAAITKFQIENQGRLPEQAAPNASAMQMAQMHLLNLSQTLNRAQQDKMMLETQLATVRDKQNYAEANVERTIQGSGPQIVRNEQYINLDKEIAAQSSSLAALKELYGSNHPDVKKQEAFLDSLLKRRMSLEKEDSKAPVAGGPTTVRVTSPEMQKAIEDLKGEQRIVQVQIANKLSEIEEITRQQAELQRQIAGYQKRLEDAPLNERQYASLMSEFALTKQAYEEAVKKHESAMTSKSVEDQKAGENLEVVDSPSLPEQASEPKRGIWVAVGAFAGLFVGVVLAAGKEVKDTSLKNLKDVRAYTNLPVLSSVPLLENALLVRRKRRLAWLAWSSGLIVGCILMSASVYYHMTNV